MSVLPENISDILYPKRIFTFGNMANFWEYLLLTPPPPSQHRQPGHILKLAKLHFLTYPIQTTWSALEEKLFSLASLALLVKDKSPPYLNL
jgi:hypothetical protein